MIDNLDGAYRPLLLEDPETKTLFLISPLLLLCHANYAILIYVHLMHPPIPCCLVETEEADLTLYLVVRCSVISSRLNHPSVVSPCPKGHT